MESPHRSIKTVEPFHHRPYGANGLQDYFFSNGNTRLRIEGGYNSGTVQKKRVGTAVAKCVEMPQFSFCFHLKQEHPVKNHSPVGPITSHVRLQTVLEFTYKDAFRYSFKEVLSGKTKEQAAEQAPTYEIEIELIPFSTYLMESSDQHIADSLLMKVMDLVGRFDFDGKLVKITSVFDQSSARKYKKRKSDT